MEIHAQITTKAIANKIGLTYYFTGKPCKRGHYHWRDRNSNCILCQKVRDYNSKYRDYQKWMYRQKKAQCKYHGIPFNLDLEDVVIPEVCPVLGIRIHTERKECGSRDGIPSIDRINPELGYVKGNVCVISLRANVLKNDATSEELKSIVKYIEEKLK